MRSECIAKNWLSTSRNRYNTGAMASLPSSDPIAELLEKSKTIAVVGLSDSPLRPSHGVSAYMQTHGYRIIPVNPKIGEALGEKSYASLLTVPEKIDIVISFDGQSSSSRLSIRPSN